MARIPQVTKAQRVEKAISKAEATPEPIPTTRNNLVTVGPKEVENAVVLGSINFGFMHSPTLANVNTNSKTSRNIPTRTDASDPVVPRETIQMDRTTMDSPITSPTEIVEDVPPAILEPPIRHVDVLIPDNVFVTEKSVKSDQPFNNFRAPIATNLFKPERRLAEELLPNIIVPDTGKPANSAPEVLMAGGVMRFPLKTSSKFRFLLLDGSNTESKAASTVNTIRPRVQTRHRFHLSNKGMAAQSMNIPVRFDTKGQQTGLDRPPAARRRIDVTTFG